MHNISYKDRLQALYDLEILGINDQKEFDDIAELARIICEKSTCLITLLTEDQQWFLSKKDIEMECTPIEYSFCSFAIKNHTQVTVISDLSKNDIFRNNPFVTGEHRVRFYAGAPLLTAEGHALGTICVLDQKPGNLTELQIKALKILADRVVSQIALRKVLINQEKNFGVTYEKLQAITAQIPDAIVTLDREFNITYINRVALMEVDQVFQKNILDLIHPDCRETFITSCNNAFDNQQIFEQECKIVSKLGITHWFLMKISPLKNNKDEVTSLLLIGKDITQVKAQSKQLLLNETRYRDIVENTSDMIQSIDGKGNIIFVNKSWLATLGYQYKEVIGKNIQEFLHEGMMDNYVTAYRKMKEGQDKIYLEIDLVAKNGARVSCAGNINCSYRDDEIMVIRGIFHNITEQKKYEHNILKSRLMLNEAQKMSGTGSVEWNLETGNIKWSDGIYSILGISRTEQEPEIQYFFDMIHEDDKAYIEKTVIDGIKAFKPTRFEFRLRTPGNQIKYIDGKGSPFLIRNKKVVIILFTMQDITETKNFEKKVFRAIVQTEEKERTRIAGELHDGACQYLASGTMIVKTLEKSLRQPVEQMDIQRMRELGRHGKTSIEEALNIIRVVSHDLFPKQFYEKGLINSVKELLEMLQATSPVKYTFTINGTYVESDTSVSINLFRIIQEFIRNSQKYSGATRLDITMFANNDTVEFRMEDNGKGFNLDAVNKNCENGIGLVNMKNRIQAIGGYYNYTTTPGNGVKLVLRIPV
jgi:PAS domain S-box-containing protein